MTERYDLDIIDVDLATRPKLTALSARWQARNSALRVQRITKELLA